MVQSNLSFSLLEKYLEVATAAGFIQVHDYIYQLTERGREFLRTYKHFHERYTNAQKMLDSLDSERERLAELCKGYGIKSELELE
jgi:DNA-binding PadR family transcriptional regulator